MWFFASVEGTAAIHAQARDFVAAFVRRIETGLLPHAPRWRCQYRVTRQGADGLRFRAMDWWTAINVGLNDVELAVAPGGRVRYAIRYWRWASYALALSGAIGVLLIATFLVFDIRDYIVRHPRSAIPGLSTDQNVAIGWAMVLVWGFAWPWILIALHKRPLHRLMDQIVAEVDAAAMQ
jgi:hypothetical protein